MDSVIHNGFEYCCKKEKLHEKKYSTKWFFRPVNEKDWVVAVNDFENFMLKKHLEKLVSEPDKALTHYKNTLARLKKKNPEYDGKVW